jgi:ribosome-binding protein aMBF1 (putative translation factor)
MKLSKAIQRFIERAKEDDSYWIERTKLDFSLSLEKQRRIVGMSYADIARKISSSAAYVTKIFRGDVNMTIESMVKLARATGGQLQIQIVDENASARIWDKIPSEGPGQLTKNSATIINFPAGLAKKDAWPRRQEAA